MTAIVEPPASTSLTTERHPGQARRIEETSLRAWPALTESDFDGWRLRFAEGYTRRSNSITPLDPSRLAIDDKIATCERLYADRALPAIFRLTPFAPPELRPRLLDRGYRPGELVDVLARPLGGGAGAGERGGQRDDTPPLDRRLAGDGGRLRHHDLDSWLDIFGAISSAAARSTAPARAAHGAVLRAVSGSARLLAMWVDGSPVACGMAVVTGDLLGLFDLVTAAAHRNRGYGAELVRRALRWGTRAGAREAYLQVLPDNAPACRIYARAGFATVYRYQYIEPR